MYRNDVEALSHSACARYQMFKTRPWAYLVSSLLGGIFVGLGVIASNTAGTLFAGEPVARFLQGVVFSVALALVIMAGAELFTGNNLIIGIGALEKKLRWNGLLLIWLFCFIGNLLGAWLLVLLFNATGLLSGPTLAFVAKGAQAKAALPFLSLLTRAILCNILVCLPIWTSFRLKSEAAKLMMIFLCILTFVLAGFEHSVANMTFLSMALLHPEAGALGLSSYFYVLLSSALGNILGGFVFVALPYWFISKEKQASVH